MIVITNQAEFDSVFVTNLEALPTNEIIRIVYNGVGYEVKSEIQIKKSNVIIQGYGVRRPKLYFTGHFTSGWEGVMEFIGAEAIRLENIHVEYLDFDCYDEAKITGSGIKTVYVGETPLSSYTQEAPDLSKIGATIPNKIGITIKNCVFQNHGGNGILFERCGNSKIIGNKVKNCKEGMFIYSLSHNNIISDNVVENNSEFGIDMYNASSNNIISNNISQNNTRDGIRLNLRNCNNIVQGNLSQNNGGDGITLGYGTKKNTIIENICNNNKNGISIISTTDMSVDNSITSNTIQDNAEFGIYLSSLSKNTVIMSNSIKSVDCVKNDGINSLILANTLQATNSLIISTGTNAKTVDNILVQ